MKSPCTRLFLYCRAGFERETLAECASWAASAGLPGSGEFQERSGHVLFRPEQTHRVAELLERLHLSRLTFARHLLAVDEDSAPLPPGDRLAPLLARLSAMGERHGPFSALWLGAPESDAGRALLPLCRALQGRLESALRQSGLLVEEPHRLRAEVIFLSGTQALTGFSRPDSSAPWPMGIPRLRRPSGSPSRAAMKLEEALVVLLTPEARKKWLAPGRTAVDLGAAPGGWTRILLQDGLSVTAVDRAALAPELLASPRLRHAREDGFRFRPPRPVDWLLCDMVEQPRRIAELVGLWAASGWCRNALFNLKLPMKKRYEELQICRNLVGQALKPTRIDHRLSIRQLYHDREEVTALLHLSGSPQ
ncbi:MAG: 23S rRNA (cytidine(2498)-2'-O)-methyltransferase RlmM [Magnetococcales bacterium]|nr:23S rRNA (cytidine(2498)-2'-O)-methyltransferase RlmM [Magnetococcales bacterium]